MNLKPDETLTVIFAHNARTNDLYPNGSFRFKAPSNGSSPDRTHGLSTHARTRFSHQHVHSCFFSAQSDARTHTPARGTARPSVRGRSCGRVDNSPSRRTGVARPPKNAFFTTIKLRPRHGRPDRGFPDLSSSRSSAFRVDHRGARNDVYFFFEKITRERARTIRYAERRVSPSPAPGHRLGVRAGGTRVVRERARARLVIHESDVNNDIIRR